MTPDSDFSDLEPSFAQPWTSAAMAELQSYGHLLSWSEPDPRPMPEERSVHGAIVDIFDALVSSMTDTRLEADLADVLWSMVNLFHRAAGRIERELDGTEQIGRTSGRGTGG